jgi:hypothetical protein
MAGHHRCARPARAGVLFMSTWDRAAPGHIAKRDFTGLVCGTPLDNPDGRTGTACHSAVNRQTASPRPRRPADTDLGPG